VTASAVRPHAETAPGIEEIRAQFPALERVHGKHRVAYFDGPGGTQVPVSVVDAVRDYLLHHNANSHWAYPSSIETDVVIDAARAAAADLLNANPNEVAFGANMTTLTFSLSRALAPTISPGDEIVVTELDHHANVAPWTRLAAERGAVIRTVRMNTDTYSLDWADLERAIGARTKLLAIGAASNALGTITDVARATELAHAVGALVFVDAVHYAPHVLVDVRQIGCDFLACSAYKFYGPHIGVLWGKGALIESLDAPRLDPAPQESPERLETGTQNHEGIIGAAAAVDFLVSLSPEHRGRSRRESLSATFAALHARGMSLLEKLWNSLDEIDGLKLHGPKPGTPRTPTLSFTIPGVKTDDIAIALAERGVFVSNGDFYAATIVERLGLVPDGLLRVGCSCYTSESEVDRLIDGVKAFRVR
jgi:cysteine desulfurase family protein (TIGR01976 family)